MMPTKMLAANALVGRRLGRIAFGAVLLAGTAYLIAAAWSSWPRLRPGSDGGRIIVTTWLAATAAAFVTSWVAARVSRAAARASRVWHPERLFAESLVVPTIGIAVHVTITLHMAVVLPLWEGSAFDVWTLEGLLVTGFAHIVFATVAALRAHALVAGRPVRSPRSICIAAVTVSYIPLVLLFAIPPALVAITGLPLIPLIAAMEAVFVRERREIAMTVHPLPRATLRMRDAAHH